VGQRATAEKAVYVRDTDAVTLTGAVQVTDGDSTVWADQVVMEHESGDATADGSVKANYQPGGAQTGSGAEPTHVLASRAVMRHATGVATFYAGAGKLARLWQGASQVEAPVLVFDQKKRTMEARGASETNGPGAALPVRAVFVNGVTERSKKAEVVRVASKELTYSDGERRADFTGGVVVENADGTMRGQQATIYLQAAHSGSDGKGAGEGAFLGGSVERIVASGRIEIDQPGRKATGTQVVYTAGDGMFVLTGTPAAPPKVMDETRGTVTGAMLRFHTGDNSVVVSSGADSTGQRVHTETRVKQ
jgi:lipopolysaccharide export system protein LptA